MVQPTTIDPNEVAYYQRLAGEWWNRGGKFWPLHRLNELRVKYLKDQICTHFDLDASSDKPLAGLEILDIGCGGGILSESMAKLGARVIGIDVSPKSLQVANLHSTKQKLDIEYRESTAEQLASEEQQFDVVLNMEVIEHVVELPIFLHSCTRLLKAGGITFIATINRNPVSWLFAILGAEYILRWLPRGTHQWSKFVKPAELTRMINNNGLWVKATIGVRINPFTRHFSLTRTLLVNYMTTATFSSRI